MVLMVNFSPVLCASVSNPERAVADRVIATIMVTARSQFHKPILGCLKYLTMVTLVRCHTARRLDLDQALLWLNADSYQSDLWQKLANTGGLISPSIPQSPGSEASKPSASSQKQKWSEFFRFACPIFCIRRGNGFLRV